MGMKRYKTVEGETVQVSDKHKPYGWNEGLTLPEDLDEGEFPDLDLFDDPEKPEKRKEE